MPKIRRELKNRLSAQKYVLRFSPSSLLRSPSPFRFITPQCRLGRKSTGSLTGGEGRHFSECTRAPSTLVTPLVVRVADK